jgi:hypothetical protein
MATSDGRLNRDWIDWELARSLRDKISRKLDGKSDNPLGIGLATMSLTIVNSISNTGKFTDEQKITIMSDVMHFMTDLLNDGWVAPPKKEKQN